MCTELNPDFYMVMLPPRFLPDNPTSAPEWNASCLWSGSRAAVGGSAPRSALSGPARAPCCCGLVAASLPDCFMSGSTDHARSPYYGAPLPSSAVTAPSHSSGAGAGCTHRATLPLGRTSDTAKPAGEPGASGLIYRARRPAPTRWACPRPRRGAADGRLRVSLSLPWTTRAVKTPRLGVFS